MDDQEIAIIRVDNGRRVTFGPIGTDPRHFHHGSGLNQRIRFWNVARLIGPELYAFVC
jgi:hypothetical protein